MALHTSENCMMFGKFENCMTLNATEYCIALLYLKTVWLPEHLVPLLLPRLLPHHEARQLVPSIMMNQWKLLVSNRYRPQGRNS